MDIPDTPILLYRPFLPPMEEYMREIERIWSTVTLSNNGPIHQEFEAKLTERLHVENVSLFVNGHMALEIAIKTLGLQGEVITTPFTFASTVHAISNCGLTPVFCDIRPEDFNIDASKIEDLITDKTSAIIPVHVFGTPCDVVSIDRIAQKHKLKVIYDAAHAFGVSVNGTGIGNFGDISMFSLHATKVFHSIEGGALAYNHRPYKPLMNKLRNFGIHSPEAVDLIGTNAKMNEFQAAMGVINLRYIDVELEKRRKLTLQYRQRLSSIKGLTLMHDKPGVIPNYVYFPVLIESDEFGMTRDELHDRLKQVNVFTRKYFYPLCSDFDSYRHLGKAGQLRYARSIASRVLVLPLYSTLSEETVDYICDSVHYIYEFGGLTAESPVN
ncbi:DegT/DnrJ/EryC1/StrS aminotransferase family protein [Cohnella sp. AR92]|uniref:DegT/DnrJ/EryC1/StrS family aminotransferase n=1 Tax=Cohnella sp. AR92 TaxID=648716 RepID=UPI000F8C323F|nr:DegT/DnrJ/EryC1/StrS family aminotransferase [Cohnella sp. AR92]RUS45277.1 DegT/DnrJ/EryC1/StrS family aminotransferase [Cohnella sp. AR92]